MQQNRPAVPISGEIVEQITDIDIALAPPPPLTHRNDGGKAQIPARAPLQHARCNRPGLGDQRQITGWRAWLPRCRLPKPMRGIITPKELGPTSRRP